MSDIHQLKKAINSLANLVEDNEKIALPFFVDKLSKATRSFPEDYTIGMMSNVVAKMNNSNRLFISRAEIRELYNKLYSRNTKFAELFNEELGKKQLIEEPKKYQRDDSETDIMQEAYQQVVDPVLANSLNNAFSNTTKHYTEKSAKLAGKVCSREISSYGLKNHKIAILNGTYDFIICLASFDTPKGTTNVYVPVELNDQMALIPSVFVGNNGPEDLNKDTLIDYIVSNAGNKLNIKEAEIFNSIKNIKNASEINSVDLALTKLQSEKETQASLSTNQVIYQKIAEEPKDVLVNTPKYQDDEIESFASQLNSEVGIAEYNFGKDKIKLAREIISKKLYSYGFKYPQLSVMSSDDKSLTYAVSVNNVGFKVPVKISKNFVSVDMFIANGSLNEFNKENISELISSDLSDNSAAAVSSPNYGLKPSELIENIRQAMTDGNFVKAEDTLNVLSESNDVKAYQVGFEVYKDGLAGNTQKEAKSDCKMIVKNAHSSHSICGHTNLPLHKVYQDKEGNCRPLYRKEMDETYQGAYFSNAKIFF